MATSNGYAEPAPSHAPPETDLVKIGVAARIMGTTPGTLRARHARRELVPAVVTKHGTRYYSRRQLLGFGESDRALTLGYARAYGRRYQAELDEQELTITDACRQRGWSFEMIRDHGGGKQKELPGLRRLLEMIVYRRASRLVLTHRDRLRRWGGELVLTLCDISEVEVVILNSGPRPAAGDDPRQEALQTVGEICLLLTADSGRPSAGQLPELTRMLEKLA